MTAITLEHRGAYIDISRAFDRLFAWLFSTGSFRSDVRSVAIFYDDPTSIPAAQLRSRAGVVTNAMPTLEPPFECTPIAGGEYAVLRHKGPYARYEKAAYDWLYGQWLPQSGRADRAALRHLPPAARDHGIADPWPRPRETSTRS